MYPLNNDPEESERLTLQLDLLKGDWLNSLFVSDGGYVLDVGCGTGDIYKSVPSGWSYVGVDTTDRFVKTSDSQYFFKKDILNYKSDIKFDVVICRLVLWSLPQRLRVLEHLKTMCKPDTLIYCYEPNDLKLEFSEELLPMTTLAQNWQATVMPQGSDPFIGNKIKEIFESNSFNVLAFKEHYYSYSSSDDLFRNHLENLLRIFSQCNPPPNPELIENAVRCINTMDGKFTECYVEMIGGVI